MRYLPLLLVPLLLLCCCAEEEGSTVRLISVARDYSAYYRSLDNAPNDQAAMSEELYYLSTGSASGYEETLFREEDGLWTVNHLRSDWDTDSVLEALESVEAEPGDLLIFHYSGHGDSSGSLVVDDSGSYLSLDDLLGAVSGIGGKKLILLDSCYSGNAVTATALSNGESFSDSQLVSSSFLKAAADSFLLLFSGGLEALEDTWVFAAVTDEQEAWDVWDTGEAGQEDYGAFTYQVLKALGYDFEEGVPGRSDGTITLYGVYEAVMESISEDLKQVATPQVTLSPIDLVLF